MVGKSLQRECIFLSVVEVKNLEAPEVTGHQIARPLRGLEALHVVLRLLLGLAQIFAPALVLDDDFSLPDDVYVTPVPVQFLDRILKTGHLPAVCPVALKKGIPERLCLGILITGVFPAFREGGKPCSDFIH